VTSPASSVSLRAVAAAVVLTALAGTAFAGGWVEERVDRTVIHVSVYQLPDPNNTGTANRADVAAVREFVRRFPETFEKKYKARYEADPAKYGDHKWGRVEVELHPFSGIQVEGVENDLLAIAGDMAPDILYVNFRKSDNYIQNDFLYPLDKPEDGYLAGMTEAEKAFRVFPKIWPVIKRKGPRGKMQVWALPYGGAVGRVLVYRKDLFDEKGVPYPTAQWTWEKMYQAAKKITDPKRGIYGLMFTRGKHESWWWVTFLWSAGAEAMTYDEEKDEWRCAFGSREAAVALEYYTRICNERWEGDEGKIRRGYAYMETGAWSKWDRGEIGMMFEYIDEKLFSQINPEVTGMVPVPLGPTGKRGGELNSRMMGLFSGIKHPAVRDAAWEYMRFYDSEEAVRIKTRIMVEGGFGRFVNPRYLTMFGYPEVVRLSPKGWKETFEIAVETGKPEPYGTNSNLAYDMMTFPIQEARQLAMKDKLPADYDERVDVMHDIVQRANQRANEEMIGLIPPRERMIRNAAAVVVLIAIAITFGLVFRHIAKVFKPPALEGFEQLTWGFRRYKWAYFLLIPAMLTILVWRYIPLIRGSVMAFQDYRLVGESAWVGVRNFGDLLWDGFWWRSVYDALRYSFLIISLTFMPPIILAILLQEVPRGKLVLRTIFYLPAVITGLVTVLLWKMFYDASESGVLNALVLSIPSIVFIVVGAMFLAVALLFAKRLFYHEMLLPAWLFVIAGGLLFITCAWLVKPILLPPDESVLTTLTSLPRRLFATAPEAYRWLDDESTAMLACVIPMVWAGMGPGCLIYLAALKGIPDDLYEAADVDGATFIDKVMFIIFPILKPLIIINFVGVFIASWYGATGRILAMTAGGAKTEVAGLHIFYKAFIFLKFGPATAMAWMLGFMLIGFTVYQLRILSRLEFRTTGDKK